MTQHILFKQGFFFETTIKFKLVITFVQTVKCSNLNTSIYYRTIRNLFKCSIQYSNRKDALLKYERAAQKDNPTH